jgi:menaquinone-specific isochorismate synthase
LDKLLQQQPAGFAFLFQFADGHAFLGLSPEQLYARNGDQVRSEAVAGTRIRGEDTREDEELRCELLSSDKERREHRFVLANVVTAFRQVCRSYAVDDAGEVLRLSRQQHLLTRISGKLSEGVTDRDLCASLHPTPAVGGSPTDKALDFLTRMEDFDRGWFAGPVGWFRRSSSELAVAIRSGLIENECFHLYSGAGIVDGSNPLSEWEETEAKIRQYLDVFYGH